MSEAIGIMEGAFFVSRGELIDWVNHTFHVRSFAPFLISLVKH